MHIHCDVFYMSFWVRIFIYFQKWPIQHNPWEIKVCFNPEIAIFIANGHNLLKHFLNLNKTLILLVSGIDVAINQYVYLILNQYIKTLQKKVWKTHIYGGVQAWLCKWLITTTNSLLELKHKVTSILSQCNVPNLKTIFEEFTLIWDKFP